MTKCWLFILAPFARAADQRGTFTQNRKSPSMINTRPSRNAKNASDLVAPLTLFTTWHRYYPATFAGYMRRSTLGNVLLIAFIAKFRPRQHASELFDRKS